MAIRLFLRRTYSFTPERLVDMQAIEKIVAMMKWLQGSSGNKGRCPAFLLLDTMENLTCTLTDIEAANAHMDLVEGNIRPLGSTEHLFWLLDQGSPMHFSLAAQIEGHATVGEWRAALDHVQRRHPFFSVCIER